MEGVRPVDRGSGSWDADCDRFSPRRGAADNCDNTDEADHAEDSDHTEDAPNNSANDDCPAEYEAEDYIGPPPPRPNGDGNPVNNDPNAPLSDEDHVELHDGDRDEALGPPPPSPSGQTVDPNIESANDINAAIDAFKKAADEAAVRSLVTAIVITKVNGVDNAVKKINPA